MHRNFESLHAFVSNNYKGNPREEALPEVTEYFESFTGFELIALRELLWMEIVRRTKQEFSDL